MVTKIRGVTIPVPTDCDIKIADFVKNAERNAKGDLIADRIAVKRQINISYNLLSSADLKTLLELFDISQSMFFTVNYIDEIKGAVTGTFYCSDRDFGVKSYINGVLKYKDLKFSLTEK